MLTDRRDMSHYCSEAMGRCSPREIRACRAAGLELLAPLRLPPATAVKCPCIQRTRAHARPLVATHVSDFNRLPRCADAHRPRQGSPEP